MRVGAAEAREAVCAFVKEVRLVPEGGTLRIEVRGELGAILRLAEGARNAKGAVHIAAVGALREQIKKGAGAGFEPAAFRL